MVIIGVCREGSRVRKCEIRSWHRSCFEWRGMSITGDSSMLIGPNEIMARKLMDAAMVKHEAHTSNIANEHVPGYHKVALDRNFDVQLNALMDAGDFEGMEALEPGMETAKYAGGVSLEQELQEDAKNTLNYQVLAMMYGTNMSQVKLVVE